MAKSRIINTRFWIDDYISNLDPTEKLLFLYFLTNPYTDISGVYEVPLKHIALETGLDKEMVIKIVNRFERDNKIVYKNGWVGIKNFAKHQQDNPKVKKGIEIGLSKAPKDIIDSLYIDYGELSHSNSNSNSNLNSNVVMAEETSANNEIPIIIDMFKEINPSYKKWFGNKTQRQACKRLLDTHGIEKLEKIIKILPKSNNLQFCPVITTPLQLEDKFAQLATSLQKIKNNQPIIL